MANEKYPVIAGMDIGSNQVCCVFGIYNEERQITEIINGFVLESEGIEKGSIVSMQDAGKTIETALEKICQNGKVEIQSMTVALRGSFIQTRKEFGEAIRLNREYSFDDETIDEAKQHALGKISVSAKETNIQSIIAKYSVDDKEVIDPCGMTGDKLSIEVLEIIAKVNELENIKKALTSGGIRGEDCTFVYGYSAASEIAISKADKISGCLVVDFGDLTTGIISYSKGKIRNIKECDEGSHKILLEIMNCLRVPREQAKIIKENFASAYIYVPFNNKQIVYTNNDGEEEKCDSKDLSENAISGYIDYFLEKIQNLIETEKFEKAFLTGGGIIILGGGAKLDGLDRAFNKAFNCRIKRGVINEGLFCGHEEILKNSSYFTALGAIQNEVLKIKQYKDGYGSKVPVKFLKIIRRIKDWFSNNS
jgi:cell division protein FtsA